MDTCSLKGPLLSARTHLWSFIIWKKQEGSQHLSLSLLLCLSLTFNHRENRSSRHERITLPHLVPHSGLLWEPTPARWLLVGHSCTGERAHGLTLCSLCVKLCIQTGLHRGALYKFPSATHTHTHTFGKRSACAQHMQTVKGSAVGRDKIPAQTHTHTLSITHTHTTTQISSSLHCDGCDLAWQANPDPAAFIPAYCSSEYTEIHRSSNKQARGEAGFRILDLSVAAKSNSHCLLCLVFSLYSIYRLEVKLKTLKPEWEWCNTTNSSVRFIFFLLLENINNNFV